MAELTEEQIELKRIRTMLAERKRRAAGSEIGEIPPIKDTARRDRCERDLLQFLVEYFPASTGLKPFGDEQVKAIKRLEHCILDTGRVVNLLPRGYCKSSISEGACLWAALYGHRRFILFLGANAENAKSGLETIKTEIEDNPLLQEDFPEVCHPIAKLEGKHQRCASQTHLGKLTNVEWTTKRIVFPTIPGSRASSVIISADGLLSAKRGARFRRPDGESARPDFVVIDDPQTDQSAMSPLETAKRLRITKSSVLRLGGHGKQVSVCCNATLICEGDYVDQLATKRLNPSWTAVRSSSVTKMPDALDSLWLGKYADLLKDFDEDDFDGQRKALDNATEFYISHRDAMDAGSEVAWEHVPLEPGEISALQHALNILILEGQEVFDAEVQNQPTTRNVSSHLQITKHVATRVNGLKHLEIPENLGAYVWFVDVHDEILYYVRAIVQQNCTGSIVDYGSYPQQPTRYFSHSKLKRKLTDLHPGMSVESAILKGLTHLIKSMAEIGDEEGKLSLSCGLIDAGYKPDIITEAMRLAGIANVYSSRGIGIGPAEKPMPEYDVSPARCIRAGPDPLRPRWFFPREYRKRVHFDTNYWKDFMASRLTQDETTWCMEGVWQQHI